MANDIYKKAGDPTPFEPFIKDTTDSQMSQATYERVTKPTESAARATAEAYTPHGANGNSVRSGSSAIAPHDKGR